MSYYRYITGLYKSYLPQLNRTLRSSSVPRHVPDLDTSRYARASSVPPSCFSSNSFMRSATPFADRARSVPPMEPYSYRSSRTPAYTSSHSYSTPAYESSHSYTYTSPHITSRTTEYQHYTDYDNKVIDYTAKLHQQDQVRSYVKSSSCRSTEDYYRDGDYRTGFAQKYNFYDAGKFYPDYLYSSTNDVMGSWKHYNRSAATFNERNNRAKSPLISRELDRYMKHKPRSALH